MSRLAQSAVALLAQEPGGCGGLEHALLSCHGDLLPTILLATVAAAVVAAVGGTIAALVLPELMNAISGLNQALAGSAAASAAGAAATSAGGVPPYTLDEILHRYDQLGDTAPEINLAANEAAYAAFGAHTLERHGPDIPLNGTPGTRTIEGRIYGDPPWGYAANWSHRWTDWTTMHRTINRYLYDNWENIRMDLASGQHRAVFDAGHRVGEGYFNSAMHSAGPRRAVYHATSLVRIVVQTVPDSDRPQPFILSAFPTGR